MEETLRSQLAYQPVELDFGTSGLRGLASDMTDLECYINSLGFIHFVETESGLSKGAVISLAGDLRESTPRILLAVVQAITDAGFKVEYCGLVPTPTIAYWAQEKQQACIMVTGSHIPADRNGIKFYKVAGEVLKSDEQAIKASVAQARQEIYTQDFATGLFQADGSLKNPPVLTQLLTEPLELYEKRYTDCFGAEVLKGKQIVVYEHSAVGRDIVVELLQSFGAEVIAVDRSDTFVSIDTENITPENAAYFKKLASDYPNNFAIVSTDGDSDRPFVVDETGMFHRGDLLGVVVAEYLGADFAALPISANDAVDMYLKDRIKEIVHTKIGSPYVIEAMQKAVGMKLVGWEVNGGFLLGNDMQVGNGTLKALPTRDAFLPILVALCAAITKQCTVSELFAALPHRYTGAGLLDNFPLELSSKIKTFIDTPELREGLSKVFSQQYGFGELVAINMLDGLRLTFSNNDIAHIRPSGNAPQLRIYSVADTQERAQEIVALGIGEPDGLLRQLKPLLTTDL